MAARPGAPGSDPDDELELGPGDVAEIVRIFSGSNLEELRIEVGRTRLFLSRRPGSGAAPDADPAPAAEAEPGAGALGRTDEDAGTPLAADPAAPTAPGLVELRSPLLGVFYRRPSPSEPPFVEVGSTVAAADPVCIVDVMKMFTRVEAGTAGRIVEICAEDGQLVEHGQVLMRIEPA